MRRIINYIRQLFCRHQFEYEECRSRTETKEGTKVSRTCKKCGWHTSYWKF